ncbi:MAG: hypothetical protein N3A69_17790, partial [Leptospiraceae bacterium]|nr:hypothetical protein [Leptospiraceae bacterium]
MIEQIKILGKLIKRLYGKEVYATKVEEKVTLVDGRTKKLEEYKLYTSYPYDEEKAIVITCEKNCLGEKIKELERCCDQRDLMLAKILRYCRENRIDVPTDYLDYLERTEAKTLEKIFKGLEEDLKDLQIANSKKKCLVLYYTTENGENVVCGGGITLYPIPSNRPEEILTPKKIEKLRNVLPWEDRVKDYEIKELVNELSLIHI